MAPTQLLVDGTARLFRAVGRADGANDGSFGLADNNWPWPGMLHFIGFGPHKEEAFHTFAKTWRRRRAEAMSGGFLTPCRISKTLKSKQIWIGGAWRSFGEICE